MTHLTPSQVETLRTLLEEKRAKLQEYHESVDAADPVNDPNRDLYNESGEDSLENYEMLESEALEGASSDIISEIDAALQRIEDGSYGLDEESGEPISFARLQLHPTARNTVSEAKKQGE